MSYRGRLIKLRRDVWSTLCVRHEVGEIAGTLYISRDARTHEGHEGHDWRADPTPLSAQQVGTPCVTVT